MSQPSPQNSVNIDSLSCASGDGSEERIEQHNLGKWIVLLMMLNAVNVCHSQSTRTIVIMEYN